MGAKNRERRRAKQKAREEQQRRRRERLDGEQDAGHPGAGGFGGSPFAGLFGHPATTRELVDRLAQEAVVAIFNGDEAVVQRCRAALVEGEGQLGGRRAVDLALVGIAGRELARLWQRGWQPADVVRLVRREYGARHGRITIDLVAAQLREYAPTSVDERWDGQLRELDATVWWSGDDELLPAIAERESLSRSELIDHLFQVLHLCSTCPQIELLCPPPGRARRDAAGPAPVGSADPRQLDRVRALLAKAESTSFPEEAEAYTTKAQELMTRYSIDSALLAASTGAADEPTGRRIGVDNPYEAPKVLLLDAVARANRCRTVWTKAFGYVTVLGFPADVDAVELLFTSLLVQATTAMVREGTRRDAYGRSSTRSFRQSFLTAYAERIGERLTEATRQATEEAGRDMAGRPDADRLLPVLASREDAVHAKVAEFFPNLVGQAVSITNREGWASGRAAADHAQLTTRRAVDR